MNDAAQKHQSQTPRPRPPPLPDWITGRFIYRNLPGAQDHYKTGLAPSQAVVEALLHFSETTTERHEPIYGEDFVKSCYGHLDILDKKSSALLTFNGLMITIFSLQITILTHPSTTTAYSEAEASAGFVGLFIAVASVIYSHRVVNLFWTSRRGRRVTAEDIFDVAEVVHERTVMYRKAWGLSIAGAITLLLLMPLWLMEMAGGPSLGAVRVDEARPQAEVMVASRGDSRRIADSSERRHPLQTAWALVIANSAMAWAIHLLLHENRNAHFPKRSQRSRVVKQIDEKLTPRPHRRRVWLARRNPLH